MESPEVEVGTEERAPDLGINEEKASVVWNGYRMFQSINEQVNIQWFPIREEERERQAE